MTRPARQAAHVPSATRLMFTTRSPGRIVETSAPDLDDLARELVPQDRPVLEARDVPVERDRGRRRRWPRRRRGRSRPSRRGGRDPATSSTRTSFGPRRTTAFTPAARSRPGSRPGRRRRSGSRPTAARTARPGSGRPCLRALRTSPVRRHLDDEHDVGLARVRGRRHRHARAVLCWVSLLGEREARPGERERRVGRVVVRRLDLEADRGRGRRRPSARSRETARIAPARVAISCATCRRRRRASAR